MKSHILTAIFTAMLLSVSPGHAQTPEQRTQPEENPTAQPDVTIRGTIIAMPNAESTQFSAEQDLSGKPADALNALEKLIAQKKASSVANPALTTKSGQHGVSDSGNVTIAAIPVASADRKAADIKIELRNNGHKINTAFQVSNGGTKFLGSVQSSTDKAMTDYIFVRVSY